MDHGNNGSGFAAAEADATAAIHAPEGLSAAELAEHIAQFTPEQLGAEEGAAELAHGSGEREHHGLREADPAVAQLDEQLGPEAIDQISDEQAAQLAGQMQIPLHSLVLAGAPLKIMKNEEADEAAIIVGPIALNVVIPLTGEGARAVARDLTGGIQIASAIDLAKVAPLRGRLEPVG